MLVLSDWLVVAIDTYTGEVLFEDNGEFDNLIRELKEARIWQDCDVSFYLYDDLDQAYELLAYLDLDFVCQNDPELVRDHVMLVDLERLYMR